MAVVLPVLQVESADAWHGRLGEPGAGSDGVPAAAAAFAEFNRTTVCAVVSRVWRVLPQNRPRTIARLVDPIAEGWAPHE